MHTKFRPAFFWWLERKKGNFFKCLKNWYEIFSVYIIIYVTEDWLEVQRVFSLLREAEKCIYTKWLVLQYADSGRTIEEGHTGWHRLGRLRETLWRRWELNWFCSKQNEEDIWRRPVRAKDRENFQWTQKSWRLQKVVTAWKGKWGKYLYSEYKGLRDKVLPREKQSIMTHLYYFSLSLLKTGTKFHSTFPYMSKSLEQNWQSKNYNSLSPRDFCVFHIISNLIKCIFFLDL